ncbi:hypothetical protein HPP92_023652 [Vanilla planifolia]|uniref:SAM-dependent MTase RsmB/NOP-type domain-containing protein n=1 Tax=Vanilla planifolia TaxID=51239 RepID=A0A835PQF9_VANPL|nr:hypothetical protein HPP92_023652 [Vanilla planifolia]
MAPQSEKKEKPRARRISGGSAAERSAYFARKGGGKDLQVLKDVLAASNVLSAKWKMQAELIYVTAYDVLFGQKIGMTGAVEKHIMIHKHVLESTLLKFCANKGVKFIEELLLHNSSSVPKPRYVRVNTLKMNTECAMRDLERITKVEKDEMVPDMLVLPGGTDLHKHPLVLDGSIFLQVLDACAAPGNKTTHLAALMKGKGQIIACEINERRIRHLEYAVKCSGAQNILFIFLLNQVCAILLDPSCSGSGTSAERLDHLLPSYLAEHEDKATANGARVKKLAAFQRKALAHALSFPSVERVVYSTCSIHQEENEDVVMSVLPLATSLNFELGTPFPRWPRRGLPVFEGAEHLLRTDPSGDTQGFFIALFVKKLSSIDKSPIPRRKKRFIPGTPKLPFPSTKISLTWMHHEMKKKPCSER